MARIILNETSYFGKGAISNVATEVKARGLKKVLLVTDKDLVKFNVATKVMTVFLIPYMMTLRPTPPLKTYRPVWRSARRKKQTVS